MAFDQNLVPSDLRPLNIVRTMPEDPRIVPVTSSGRPVEGFYASPTYDTSSPNSVPAVYYPVSMPESGFVGPGNVAMRMPAPVLVPASVSGVAGWAPYVPPPQSHGVFAAPGFNSACVTSQNHNVMPQVGCIGSDQASEESDDSVSGRKVKFLCSFGGKILPRPSDGALRYVGGQTRIISVRRDVSFAEFVKRMVDIYGQNVAIKYQLPEEDLDALVSISCSDDLDNMMDEYEKLLETSTDGSAKLRVFLFSSSEVVSAGLVHFEAWHDSGQKYVDVVNGFTDDTCRLRTTRKESTVSAASNRGSDANVAEVIDNLAHVQLEVTVPTSIGVLSPREKSTVPQEATPIMPGVTASPAIPTDTYPASAGVPVSYSGLPPPPVDTYASPMSSPMVISSQPLLPATVDSFDAPLHNAVGNYGRLPAPTRAENELYNPLPFTAQQKQVSFELQQPGTTVPSASPYLQGCVALHHETLPRAEYVQPPTQLGFPGQLLGTVAPVFTPQHMTTGGTLQQFIPARHMTMYPSNRVSVNPNLVQPMMPQQIRFEHYPVDNSVVQRVAHVSTDQGYNAYPTQVPAVGGEAYGWHKIPQTEQMVFSEGLTHQQATTSEKVSKFDDCFMCQKALPHAHSDSLALDNRESPVSTMPESQSTFHSLHLDVQGRPIDNILAGEAAGETISEQPGAISQETQVLGHVNHNNGNVQPIVEGLANNAQGLHDKHSASFQKAENPDHPRLPLPQALIGITGGLQPHGVFVGNIPQSSHDNLIHPPVNPSQYQFKQEDTITKPSTGDTAGLGGMVLKTSEHLVDDAREDCSGNLSTTAAVEDNAKSYAAYDHIRQRNGRMENLRVNPYEAVVSTEQVKPPTDNPQVINGEVYSDSVLNRHKTVLDGNNLNGNEAVTSSSSQYVQPAQIYEMPQAPQFVDPGLVSHSKFGVNLVHDETSSSAFANIDSAHTAQRTAPVGEWKVNAAMNQPNIASSDAESVPSNDNISLLAPPNVVGDLQDNSNSLFSNQDFWNLRETHFPPPIPSKIQIKKENSGARHPSNDNSLESNGDFRTGNNMGFGTDMRLDQGNSHSAGSAEEQIKQQLQAVAEDVASSVLQSSLPSNPDLSGLDQTVSPSTSHQIGEVPTTDHDKDRNDASDSVSLQDLRARLPDKTNVGFPLSDGLGRLQIIRNSDLEELRELGSGTFGTVYHGKWRGTDVAIKRINDRCFAGKPSEQERMRDDFWNEAIKLADLHHPNVVAFYGVVLDGPGHSVATVTEYMTDGSLRSALQKSERNLDKRKRLLISMDVAFGMEYLHGKNIVHFDLKSDNLLVNLRDPHRPICKVGDLGLSKVKCHTLISGGVRGTLPWMAPELLNGSSSLVSEKVDVYSFGIVMWELLTREEPYADLHYGAIIGGIVSNTLRPPVPEGCDPEWRSLMEQCWSAEPSERPNFTVIANELRTMASKIPPKTQNQHAAAAAAASKQPPVKS